MIMTPSWIKDSVFYHIYPLGLCGASEQNDFHLPDEPRLEQLYPWLDHIQSLGVNALYIGPIFQAIRHGYDTVDYYRVDRRLGNNATFADFARAAHQHGIRLVLDAVFNHVGRDFWAFQDVLQYGEGSAYKDWFYGLRFGQASPLGDPFTYEGWQGHYGLVKLNLSHPDVRAHLFDAVRAWMDLFEIDGLRLDAADCIDLGFLQALRQVTQKKNPEFWLMGEVVHGDYREWANPQTLDSVTNYEIYKGLYSSLVEANYFEVAYELKRQFGEQGIYHDLWLYNFVDNHDVDRVASKLEKSSLLYPLYILLFTMPGVPSIYYGSEWGLRGAKADGSDAPLRPALDLTQAKRHPLEPGLPRIIQQLAQIRKTTPALTRGDYREVYVAHQQLAFQREMAGQLTTLVCLNSAEQNASFRINAPDGVGNWQDLLNPGEQFSPDQGQLSFTVPPTWGRILAPAGD